VEVALRVALINPMFRLPIDTRTTPHLGLAYLAAVSERRGDEVRVYDADVEDQPLAEFLAEFRPHLVGITANTPQVKQVWRTAAAIKQELPQVPVVLGGPHVSVVTEELDFESLRQPPVDLVVRGEGEGAWIEISDRVDAFLRDQPADSGDFGRRLMDPALDLFGGLPNISYKTSDGELHRNLDGPVISDLDSLPWPAYR
jgi:magnesium-protoporphyrin IX monomethyl ester (oxidative) cyclase